MKIGENKIRLVVKLCVVVLVIGAAIIWGKTAISKAKIHNGQIQRSYEELLKYLEEAPEDVTARPYEPHLSKIVQNDIQRMLNSKKELMIVYESADKSSQIKIRRSDSDEEKIQIAIFGIADYLDEFAWSDAIMGEISFYKKGSHIVIYGKNWMFPRELITTDISLTGEVSNNYCNLDLCGTEYLNNYDDIWEWDKEMTLIRVGSEFKFFKSGFQQGSTVTFAGKIIETDDIFQYILDDKQNLWYMAYSSVPEKPWVYFIKVDENVEVLDVWQSQINVMLDKEKNILASFPIYKKDGKRYSGINTSKLFSLGNEEPIETLNFDVDVIELSESNIKQVEIEYRKFATEWWAKFIYDDSLYPVYEPRMIFDGSDIPNIPEEEIERFDKMTIGLDKLDETVEELKRTYQRYEKK